ncbi:ABC transporter permease [Marinosulfonomonas sp. PRT-SC04]|nr:ABC transporter permease [Marinosulfonomonas sp. PRT-SC04]
MSSAFERSARVRWLALSPTYLVVGFFMMIPLCIMIGISFMEQNVYGGVHPNLSFDAYQQLLFKVDFDDNLAFDPAYLRIIGRSLLLAAIATSITVCVAFPVAYYIARQNERRRNLLIFLVTLPFWTNMLIRIFAWLLILGRGGIIDIPLRFLGILEPDGSLGLLYTPTAVVIGLTYTYLPLMVLPIYASMEKLDFRLVEAAADLYSNKWGAIRHVVIPLTAPGIAAGAILVFIPCMGDFITVDMLGGAKNLMLGTLVQFQFATARNWPFGSALAAILLLFVICNMLLYAHFNRVDKRQGGS